MQQNPTKLDPVPIPRLLQLALVVTGLLWIIASRTAADRASDGIATRFGFSHYPEAFLSELFFLFLILIGFAVLSFIATRTGGIRRTNALPTRPTAAREWQLGAVIGWGTVLLTVLPMMLVGDLHPAYWLSFRAIALTLLTVVTLAMSTLALEAAFRGFVFRRLIAAVGPTSATILLSAGYALLTSYRPNSTVVGILCSFLLGILLSMAYLRTHALWLGWGLHFAWAASMGIALGLPVSGLISYNTIVDTNISGCLFLTGGAYGPEAAPLTLVCLLIAIAVLYKSTRDYAWQYTHPEIHSAGYPMDVAPPPEHTAMEQKAASLASLVQIQSTTTKSPSTIEAVGDHLRDLEHQRNTIL